MEDAGRAKQAVQWVPDEKNRCGTRITWRDIVWKDIELMDPTWKGVYLKALERLK